MSPTRRASPVLLLALLLAASSFAQINLNNFYSRAVRSGQSVATHVDSLDITTTVNTGLATTRITMVVAPDAYYPKIVWYGSEEKVDTTVFPVPERYPVEVKGKTLDSIEMSLSFSLPTDFVADSMWLWVNGKPVEAYIQDRVLANSQYQQIVGQRLDPAILQYSGNGYYNLRIFPASSFKSRKIALQFHHTFDDSVAGSRPVAALPIAFDTAAARSFYGSTKRPIAYARLTCRAQDDNTYKVSLPGIRFGAIVCAMEGQTSTMSWSSSDEKTFTRTNPVSAEITKLTCLKPGSVLSALPSGSVGREHLWVGRDLKSEKLAAGFTTRLSEKTLSFGPEPDTRIIVLDIRDSVWNWNDYYAAQASAMGRSHKPSTYYKDVKTWDRARKYALLALRTYVDGNQKFNVVFAGKTPRALFDAPVKGTDANRRRAVAAICGAKADRRANTVEALSAAIRQAPSGAVMLISDLYQPALYYTKDYQSVTAAGKLFDASLSAIDSLAAAAPAMTLFSISDNWNLSRVALASGGYVLGGLRNDWWVPYTYAVVKDRRVMDFYLPPLFGSSNPTGICRFNISGESFDDLVYTLDGYGNYMPYYRGGLVEPGILVDAAKSDDAMAKSVVYRSGEWTLRVAGRSSIGSFTHARNITVSGKLGGLNFTKRISAVAAYRPTISSFRPQEDVQWAFRKTERLAADDWYGNSPAIERIGREYHIVTRQTSLLALEPGMKLWKDTAAADEPGMRLLSTTVSTDAVKSSEAVNGIGAPGYSSSGYSLDSISLDFLAGNTSVVAPATDAARLARRISVSGRSITMPAALMPAGEVTLALYDLTGRQVAWQVVGSSRAASHTWNLQTKPSRGQYLLRITAEGYDRSFRVPMIGN